MLLRSASAFFLALFVLTSCTSTSEDPSPVVEEVSNADTSQLYAVVNPFIGTGGHGHTFPGATVPFGMVQLSPDTRLDGWDGCSGYHYTDETVFGFSHTHLSGTGVSDYGDILIMPYAGKAPARTNPTDFTDSTYASSFKKENETAHAGYYSTYLEKPKVKAELTVSERVGFHRYTWSNPGENSIVIDLSHRDMVLDANLTQTGPNEVSGYRVSKAWADEQHVYFVAKFSAPIKEIFIDKDPASGRAVLGRIVFDCDAQTPMEIAVGISPVDINGAKSNLEAEYTNFDQAKKEAENRWNKGLQKIIVKGGSTDEQVMFYSALYHTMIAPNLFSDVDGRYRGMDKKIHQSDTAMYTVFSLWDTFRGTHPLYTIIEQEKTKEFMSTFLRQFQQGGELPVWELAGNETGCMIGYHSVPVILDAFVKHLIDTAQAEKLYIAMKHSAMQDKLGLASYKKYGFIRAGDEAESVSKTLEYAYDDWCIAKMALALNKTEDYDYFIQRAQNYKNLFDPQTGFLRAKMNGSWFSPFDPSEVNYNYTEANAWQYSLFVPQDINGLIDLHGGDSAFEKHLDNLFTVNSATSGREQADITGLIGQYAHGNEPSHHMAYLYNNVGKPWKTQDKVRQIMKEMYQNAPDGLSGNEDCGQMSAWYVLSAMGFYPVTPGETFYNMGVPLFPEIEIKLENGKTIKINTKGDLKQDYIKSIRWMDNDQHIAKIYHMDMMDGGTFDIELGTKQEAKEKMADDTRPLSWIDDVHFVPVPYLMTNGITFTATHTVALGHAEKGTEIYYSLQEKGKKATAFVSYTAPFELSETTTLQAYAINKKGDRSKTVEENYYLIEGGKTIKLETPYANQYAAGGDNALIDYIRGNTNYRTGQWQGFQEKDLVAVVDLQEVKPVKNIAMGFLQDIKSWVFYPPKVEFYLSEDGENWTLAGTVNNTFPDTTYGGFTQEYSAKVSGNARFVKAVAQNYGVCPSWHMGAGGATWLFADEIVIE